MHQIIGQTIAGVAVILITTSIGYAAWREADSDNPTEGAMFFAIVIAPWFIVLGPIIGLALICGAFR